MTQSTPLPTRLGRLLERHSSRFLLAILGVSALLIVPMVVLAPEEQASDNPGGPVYDLQDTVNATLPPRVHGVFLIAEASGGDDILTRDALWELHQNTEKLRAADQRGELAPPDLPTQPYLYSGFDPESRQPVVGIYTLTDAVQRVMTAMFQTTLEDATDDQVKVAIHLVLSDPRTRGFKNVLSQKGHSQPRTVLGQEIDYWTSPALMVSALADNEKLGGGGLRISATSDPVTQRKETLGRKVQEILRGDEVSYSLWGVAIDAGLEIEDEVNTAVPFITATFVMVLIVVGISLRSAWAVGLVAVGLIFMIVWLKGLSNLVGLNSSTTLDFIVPIAMISLGADFAIHAVHRYREERRTAPDARGALRLGMAGVLTALTLAAVTDAIAFLSNTSADIETVIGFGIGAGLAILAAFVVLGLAAPVAMMRLDAWRERRGAGGLRPVAGGTEQADRSPTPPWTLGCAIVAPAVVAVAQWRWVVLPAVAVVTAVAAIFAFRLEATFDVKDFFQDDSDFVVGLDKVDLHIGESGGESAIIYVQGNLADPEALAAIDRFLDSLRQNPYVAKNDAGEATLQASPVFSILEEVMASEYARAQIEAASDVSLSATEGVAEFQHDGKSYRYPADRQRLEAIYDDISRNGVSESPIQTIYDAAQVGEILFHDVTGEREDATVIVLGIPGTRQQTNVIGARDTLEEDIRLLQEASPITFAGLTGSPFTRQAALDATTNSLQRAFLIAVVACLVVTVLAMRSALMGIVTIIPIGLVVAWLYAFMYAFDFGLNFVTATIAAVSVGVGVDYSIHMTQRFREEFRRAADRTAALRRAAEGTGVALLASAATSIVGFTVMAFAPMPMFSSYGILTAIMIFLAAAAALLVLPSLLLLVTPRATEADEG